MPKRRDNVAHFLIGGQSAPDRETIFLHGDKPAIRNLALWDEILECEEANKPKPEWARKALIQYAKNKYAGIKHRGQHQIMDDYLAFVIVRSNLTQTYRPKSGKPRRFSLRRACEHAARRIYQNIPVAKLTAEHIQNIRRAYERALQRNKKGYYVSYPFLKMLEKSSD